MLTIQVDAVGAVYQYEVNVDAAFGNTGSFVGNPISNAQLFVASHISCVVDDGTGAQGPPCARSTAPPGSLCHKLTQLPSFVWLLCNAQYAWLRA